MDGKIRKRGSSSSPSSSSKVHNYRFKRAIMVGKTRVGGGSRFSTPASSWRMMPTSKSKPGGGDLDSQNYHGGGGRSRPVSARKLAATLWEVNEMPSPQNLERRRRRVFRDRHTTPGSIFLHLSDPSHSPVSERMDRSGTGSHFRTSMSNRPKIETKNGEVFDSLSNTSFMEIENRFQAQTPNGSVNDFKPRLKEVYNTLTTSKKLLKIIHRMWAHDNIPSSSMSLISALHSELERARLQVNHIIKDQPVDHTEINHLLKLFSEEKALWKTKERQAIEQLEVEKKLRRRSESLNKKLGQELAETKASFTEVLKELANEKQARAIMNQVCEDWAEAKLMKRKSVKSHEEVEKEREVPQLGDKLKEERVQMKLTEVKHQFEEKSALVDKLRSQLETTLGKKVTGKAAGRKDEDLLKYMHKCTSNGTRLSEEDDDDGEVEDDTDLVNDEIKWSNSVNRKALRSSCLIQRSISDGNEWGNQEQHTPRRSYGDDLQRFKSVKGLRDRILTKLKSRDFDDSGLGGGS